MYFYFDSYKKQEKETGFNDCKTIQQIKEHLIKYSDDKGIIGKDNTWGYGIIDPLKMLEDFKNESVEISKKSFWFFKIKQWFTKILRFFHK